jgi:hypothetical protein
MFSGTISGGNLAKNFISFKFAHQMAWVGEGRQTVRGQVQF